MTSTTDDAWNGPRSRRPRVVVLTGGSTGSRYVLSTLAEEVELCAVVRERPSRWRTLKLLMRRSRRLGWFYLLDRVLLGVYSKVRLQRHAAACSAYRAVQQTRDCKPACPILSVGSVNDERVIELLHTIKPELVIVLGTSILREPVLQSAACFVNLHVGITPLYRGAHGGFWAAANGDYDNVGVTLHRVDKGIDTGQILQQGKFAFDPATDNLLTLAAKSAVVGAEILKQWLRRNRGGYLHSPTVAPPQGQSKLFYSPGLRDYLGFERMNKKRAPQPTQHAA